MKLGAHFLPEDLPVFLESVRRADEAGYERAWLVDGQMLWHDVYVYLTHGLAATERLVFGTGVTNPLTRHYTVTASAHATLASLHPGRVVLGLGRGDNAVRTLGLEPVPTRRLAEVVPRLRDLMAGRSLDLDGTAIQIRWADTDAPIMMAATGPRNLRLAGALADIAMIQVGVNPVAVAWAIEHVREGAEEAGRDPDAVEISLLCGMWVSDNLDEARAVCRWAPACAANHLEDVVRRNPEHGMPPELSRIVDLRRDHYDYYAGHLDSSAEHTRYLTDDLIDDFALAGRAGAILDRIAELGSLGVTEISSAYLNGCFDQLERVGREVVPELAALPA